MEKVVYPGLLGRKTPKPNALFFALFNKEEWRAELEAEMLIALLEHYKIDLSGANKWFALALALARDSVPAFKINAAKRPGRPRSKKTEVALNPRGRPRKYDFESHESFVRFVDAIKAMMIENRREGLKVASKTLRMAIREEMEFLGGSRISDLSAIRTILRSQASSEGKSFYRLEFEVPRLQKRLSESRKIIRKIKENQLY